MNVLEPVRTREDCINWITLQEIETEVFGAYAGARMHALKHDFAADVQSDHPDDHLIPGSILHADGSAYHDRGMFLEYMLCGIVWRLQALAERKGVDLGNSDIGEALTGPAGTIADKLADPYFNYLAGEVQTITKAEIEAMPPAQRKAMKKALSKTPVR
ncbi:GNAT family N-acetyltransferase [Comamonas aquatilis]|uniref:hypothetical protein n=1 Tax=Comamonas aquatilis TaxID=1778406 RepID=UPI0039F144A1